MARLPSTIMRLIALFLLASPLLVLAAPAIGAGAPAAGAATVAKRVVEGPSKLQPRAPQASKRMGMRKRAKKAVIPKKKREYSSFLCPDNAIACPVHEEGGPPASPEAASALESQLDSLADWFRIGFECIELDTELNQCGGCLALGKGQDCSTIPNTRVTGCERGVCTVFSCKDGFVVSADGKECLRPSDTASAASQVVF